MKKFGKLAVLIVLVALSIILCSCGKVVDYTIYFDVDGTTYATISTTGGETIKIPDNPTKEGYTFVGWYWSNGTAFTVNSLLDAPISSDMTVYAKWITEAEYTITFDSNGGSAVSAITAHGGESVSAPSAPTKTGFSFVGWYTDNTLANVYTFSIMPESNISLYAKWNATTTSDITITFSVDGATYSSIKTTGNETIQIPNNPTKEGYTFSGWYWENGNAFNVNSLLTTPISSSMTVYAKWTIKTYYVIFSGNEGTLISGEEEQTIEHSNSAIAPIYEKDGFMLSWDKTFDNITANTTVTAVWTIKSYNLALTSNMTTAGTISGAGNKEYNSNVTITASTNPGYTWLGWYDGDTKVSIGTSLHYTFTMPAINKTYEARWMPCPVVLTNNMANAGTVSGVEITAMGDATTITATTNSGYTWLGWYDGDTKTSEGINQTYTFIMQAESKTFTAKWMACPVTLSKNISAAGSISGVERTALGSLTTITATTNPGYTWLGWYDGDLKVSEGTALTYSFVISSENKTFTAKWMPCPINLSKNIADAGTISGLSETTAIGEEITITVSTNFGYTWIGWYDGDMKISDGLSLSYKFIISTESKSYTAKWMACPVSLTKNIETAGTISGVYGATILGGQITISAVTIYSFGWDWLGWYVEDAKVSNNLSYTFTLSSEPVVYEARWSAKTYIITLDVKGGTPLPDTTTEVLFYQPYNLAVPSKQGYTFIGWYRDMSNSSEPDRQYTDNQGNSVIDWNIGVNEILYAKWINNSNIIYNKNQLINMNLSSEYMLGNDIDLEGSDWSPIGTYSNPFAGLFDGNGYKISNFIIKGISESGMTLIGFFAGNIGTIQNLILENFTINVISTEQTYAGGLAARNQGQIFNCTVNGLINITVSPEDPFKSPYGHDAYVGGLIGRSTSIYNCYADCNISVISYNGEAVVGGLIGMSFGLTVSNCYATGSIYAEGATISGIAIIWPIAYAGGIIGRYSGSTYIKNCYYIGNITAKAEDVAYAGGLVGGCGSGGSVIISTSFFAGEILAGSYYRYYYVGGIIGQSTGTSNIYNCFIDGNITTIGSATRYVGRISGTGVGTINNCHYSSNKSTVFTNDYGNIATSSNLKNSNFLKSYIFFGQFISLTDISRNTDNVWIFINNNYPKLYWQN